MVDESPFFDDPILHDESWATPEPDYQTDSFQPGADGDPYTTPEPEPVWNWNPTPETNTDAWADPYHSQPDTQTPAADFVSPDFVAPDSAFVTPDAAFDPVLQEPDAYPPGEAGDAGPPPDESAEMTPAVWDAAPVIDNDAMWQTPETMWDASDFNGLGDPLNEAPYWNQQHGENACAVVAQMSILESITGQQLSEEAVCRVAQENNWYDPQTGTLPEDVGKILDAFGVPTEQKADATLLDIASALERGDKVIVGLDALEIWNPMRDSVTGEAVEQTLPNGSNAGHAVWVTGIDQQADGSVKLIVNDSGTPDGQMKAVDAYDFVNAWSDYGNFLVVAHPPAQPVAQ